MALVDSFINFLQLQKLITANEDIAQKIDFHHNLVFMLNLILIPVEECTYIFRERQHGSEPLSSLI